MKEIKDFEMKDLTEEDLPKPILIEDLGFLFANENSNHKRHYGIFKCGLCGTEFKTMLHGVKNGNTKSCGCYQKRIVSETHKTHGKCYTRLYRIWASIKDRTLNINTKVFNDYGCRGITICDEWKNDFMSFYNWAMENGYEENKGLSIDRIDNEGNYCPENCRWTTITIQNRNQRVSKKSITGFKGVTYDRRDKVYKVHIGVSKVSIYLGSFKTPIEGAIAYNNYIIENNLEGFILNEIPEEYLI